jgi:NADH-quinone oxidoreductase subunit E
MNSSTKAKESSGLLDALRACQMDHGYLTPADIMELSARFDKTNTEIYETAGFYSMLRFESAGRFVIEVCRSAPCHVAGANETVRALEQTLGIRMGESTDDKRYTLSYTECIGQCQASPAVLVNGKLYTDVTEDKVAGLLRQLDQEEN